MVGIGIYAYKRVILKKIENVSTQTLQIKNIKENKTYGITKLKNQKSIFQVQVTITGELSKNITLYLGPKSNHFDTELRIKNGEIETSIIENWVSDSMFIKVENPDNGVGHLEFEYQFLGLD